MQRTRYYGPGCRLSDVEVVSTYPMACRLCEEWEARAEAAEERLEAAEERLAAIAACSLHVAHDGGCSACNEAHQLWWRTKKEHEERG